VCAAQKKCAPRHQNIPVSGTVFHPRYRPGNLANGIAPVLDLALLTLARPANLSNWVFPICLPPPTKQQQPDKLVVTGWGSDVFGADPVEAPRLQQLSLKEVPLQECSPRMQGQLREELHPSHLCAAAAGAGDLGGGSRRRPSTCQGDSGSPLVQKTARSSDRWQLAGVVSFGASVCGNTDYPTIFTRVQGEVNDWLRQKLNSFLSEK